MHNQLNLLASPGIAIIKSIVENKESSIIGPSQTKGRIKRGEIISMGPDDTTQTGENIPASRYGKEGDIVYFLHYYDEGGVDIGQVNGEEYFFVKWGDLRAKET